MPRTLATMVFVLAMAAHEEALPAADDPLMFRVSFDQSCVPERAVGGAGLPFVS
jgi:hypothetical protein